jgi:hypothetical protein
VRRGYERNVETRGARNLHPVLPQPASAVSLGRPELRLLLLVLGAARYDCSAVLNRIRNACGAAAHVWFAQLLRGRRSPPVARNTEARRRAEYCPACAAWWSGLAPRIANPSMMMILLFAAFVVMASVATPTSHVAQIFAFNSQTPTFRPASMIK